MDLLFHHCIPFSKITHGCIHPNESHSYNRFVPAYRWFEKEKGFYPLFLSVGNTVDDVHMTGYSDNWRRYIGSKIVEPGKPAVSIYRKKGEFPNLVLFSFDSVDGIFNDYQAWHLVLNGSDLSPYEKRLLFKPSYSRARWLLMAKRRPHTVQICTSFLDLTKAKKVWVRNSDTKAKIEGLGFQNVEVNKLFRHG